MSLEKTFPNDELAIENLSQEEIEMALECAYKVRGHIKRVIKEESKVKFMNNLIIADHIIEAYNDGLERQSAVAL